MRRLLLLATLTSLLAACASSHVITGQPRPPVPVSQVRVYFAPPPSRYEEIAQLQSNSGAFTYGEQNKTNSVLNKLREEAAKLGANGVLFQGTEDGYGGTGVSVGAGGGSYGGGRHFSGGGVGISISPRQKFARGVAIYVLNPPPMSDPGPQAPPNPNLPPRE
ncbi:MULTISPECIES: DUF4156 domain-containing protein [Lysobacter]|uniref:DUF4156 domain-containing protein n=1 Tax=Lysobacter TaxID=68 RepID=UPI001F313104|nr:MULTISPECIES: DUF4156 domain-containing protein [Lysobacter]UJB19457.1 DUF4156 domain-containing protein [Lysobacter capsici]UJQ26817.1 DUF4156 domain-containing protein [Lysobacter gummosus]